MQRLIFVLLLLLGAAHVVAEIAEPMEEVVAVGKQPGPKLWRITNGERELWVLGVLSPLPQGLDWDTSAIDAVIADADQMIQPPSVSMSINPLKIAFVLPSLWGVEKNPDNKRLVDIVPSDLYERWLELKALYIGRDRGIERKRPMIAVNELYQKAIQATGLTQQTGVHKAISKAVKRNKVPVVDTGVARRLEKPRNAIKKFKRSEIEDLACFEKTIERIEVDLAVMKQRAQAWASGDVAALRALPYEDQNAACLAAVMESTFAEEMADQYDLIDLESRLREKWLTAAEAALQVNTVTFATLPMDELLKPDGYVAALAEKGYEVRGG